MKTVINNRPRDFTAGGITVKPGPNRLTEKAATEFLEQKETKDRIEIKHLTVMDD